MNKVNTQERKNASKQTFIFKIIMVFIPVLILLIFEGVLRISGYGDKLSLFIQNPVSGYEKYMIVNPETGKKYFQKLEYTEPANDIFLTEKPEGTFRIFVMGSSVVYGFPYDRNIMFSRILHKRLADSYPDQKIEVINTAITAINSFTLRDFTDEILKYKPDAILIYAGHNEFYGAFGIGSNETMSRYRALTRLHISLMDLRIYQLMRNLIAGIAGNMKDEVHGTLMKRIVAKKDILLHSDEYNVAMERYKQNMGDILKKTVKKKVPVFMSELVCNVNGMEPFNSIPKDSLEGALDVYRSAVAAEESQDFDKALSLYYRAKDLDCIRFRASEDINSIINDLTEEYSAYKVPMLSRFQSNSANKLIGNNYMTEHVHPNIGGSFLMADAFYNEIVQSGVLGIKDEYQNKTNDYYRKNWGYTELDSLLAYHRVQLLKGFWPFVKDESEGVNYKKIYKPKSYLDSLAFSVLKNPDRSLSDIRLELAEKYEKSGQIYEAYREYEALLRVNPYIAINYRDAANCLLQLSDLPLALEYYQKSLEFEESFFAGFRISEIYLLMGDYKNAITHFEKAFSQAPEESKLNVAAKLYIAYVYDGKTEMAEALASEFKRVNAHQLLNISAKRYVFNEYIPFQTRDQVIKARQLMREDKDDEALLTLEASLAEYDSHVANRYIGEIYLKSQNYEKSWYYFTKVYNLYRFDPDFLQQLVVICLAKGDAVNAKRYLEEARVLDTE